MQSDALQPGARGNLLPAFLGVIVASNILAEKNNGFGDLLVSNRKSLLSFYVSKILAFWTLALVVQLLFLGIWCVHYWCFQQHSVVLQFEDILRWYVINEFVYMPIGILVYSSIATFVGVVTNVPAMGAVASVAHYLLQFIFYDLKSGTNIISNYLYFIPRKIDSYTASFIDLEKTLNQVGSATLGEAIIAVLFQLSFSLLLLAVSYCLLQRKYKT